MPGTATTCLMLSQLFCLPMDRTENAAPFSETQSDSAAAIFMGCCLNMICACRSPVRITAIPAAIVTHRANRVTGRHSCLASSSSASGVASTRLGAVVSSTSTPTAASPPAATRRSWRARQEVRAIHQQPMAPTKVAAVSSAPAMTCGKAASVVLLVSTATMLFIAGRWRVSSHSTPTGCCIHELAAMMKYADALTPKATIQMHSRWMRLLNRPQPKTHRPMNVDSAKKATRPSNASGAPKTSATNLLYSLQFMPNWNSCTMPVATPRAKLIRKSLPKNLVARSHASLPVKCHIVCITAIIGASPMVSGTRMKW